MRGAVIVSAAALLTLATVGTVRAETAIGAVFGYPGNVGLSLRFDRMPIGVAWSEDFIHGTIDMWTVKKMLGTTNDNLDWYFGPGVDLGLPLEDSEEFFLAIRAPIGLQLMPSPKIELFAEAAPGIQVLDDVDFYIAGAAGIRFVLGQ